MTQGGSDLLWSRTRLQLRRETVRIFRPQPRSPHPGSAVCEVALQGLQTLLCGGFHVGGAEAFKGEFFFNYTNVGVREKSQHVTDIVKLTNVVSIANSRKMTQVY